MIQFVASITPVFQLCLTICNLIVLLWAFKKFLDKPTTSLEERITKAEARLDEHDRLHQKEHANSERVWDCLEVIQNSLSILVDFEVSFCDRMKYEDGTEEIIQARKELRAFSARKE